MNAFAAFPGNTQIRETVDSHKQVMVELLALRSGRADMALALFLLHEGASAAWPLLGMQAIHAAQNAARQLIEGNIE